MKAQFEAAFPGTTLTVGGIMNDGAFVQYFIIEGYTGGTISVGGDGQNADFVCGVDVSKCFASTAGGTNGNDQFNGIFAASVNNIIEPPAPIDLTDTTAIEAWLNAQGFGVFTVSYDAATGDATITNGNPDVTTWISYNSTTSAGNKHGFGYIC